MTRGAVRWGGLAGSVLLAAAAYLGGAGYVRLVSVNPVTLLRGDKGVLLPICWVAGTALVLVAWWAGRSVVPSTRWAVITAGLWAVPLLPMIPLGSADVYAYACQGYVQFSGGDPYGGDATSCPWLASMDHVWWISPAPYGPLFLLLAAAAAGIAGSSLAVAVGGMRVIALAGLALAAISIPPLTRRSGGNAPRAVWTVLACPLVLEHLISGAHNDALMVGLLLAGLAVVSSAAGRPSLVVVGGALLGLAIAVKATAVVVVPFAVLMAVAPLPGSAPSGMGSTRALDRRSLARPALLLAGGVVAALAVMSLLAGRGLGWAAGLLHSGDTVAWTSPSTSVGLAIDEVAGLFGAHVYAVPAARVAGVAVLVVVLIALWWRTRDDPLTGAGLALAATVLCAPVFQPWYAVWPLAVLAASRFGETAAFRRWVLIPCTVLATMVLPAGYNWALATRVPGSLLMTAAVLAAAVWGLKRGLRSGDG